MLQEIEKIIAILKVILNVEDIEIKDCAIESLIDKLEELKSQKENFE